MLDLAYDPAVPPALLRTMERAARSLGLPLAAIERLGQDEALCRAFVAASRRHDTRRVRLLARLAGEEATAPRPAPAPVTSSG